MVGAKELINIVSKKLLDAGIINSNFEAKNIVFSALNITQKQLLLEDILVINDDKDIIFNLTEKRINKYPLQYIVGKWEFYNYTFFIGDGVLIPRQDTECLVESVLEYITHREKEKLTIVDLCSGSGNIAITIDKEKYNNKVIAIEKSEDAYKYLLKNIEHNKSSVIPILCDIFEYESEEKFDIIVSNPPYLNEYDMKNLQAEVRCEPEMALLAPDNGYYFYKNIIKKYKNRLNKDGLIAFEIGIGQEQIIINLLEKSGFKNVCTKSDLCGIIRVVTANL